MATQCVVLLHGLGRTSHSMNTIAAALKQDNYLVVNHSYPSRKKSIEALSNVVGDNIAECQKLGATQIDFVTHSLGGILLRQYFQQHSVPAVKRVVMLGPPNHGSEVSSLNKNKKWYKLMTGQAGQQLGTESDSLPNQLKPLNGIEIGIIAGTKSLDPWFSNSLPKPHDGKVSVASTQLDEMTDFIVVPHSHTFMANSSLVVQQLKIFLKQGKFDHHLKN